MMPKDYLIYKFSGNFVTDVSDASGTLYYDVSKKNWSKEMLKVLNINDNQLPSIYEINQLVGKLTTKLKEQLNINYDINIIVGGGDQAVGALGSGVINQGEINLSLGTSGVVFAPSSKFNQNKRGAIHSFCDATGNYHTMGVALTSGGSLKWWSENILKLDNYQELTKHIKFADYKTAPYFLPYLNGERLTIYDSKIRGALLNLSLAHKQEDLTLAVIEGISFRLYNIFMQMEISKITKIMIAGGGSKNDLWIKLLLVSLIFPFKY